MEKNRIRQIIMKINKHKRVFHYNDFINKNKTMIKNTFVKNINLTFIIKKKNYLAGYYINNNYYYKTAN